MGKAEAHEKGMLQQKSPAEFFKDNKNIAGFDNPGKALYTTIRELVENSLDSAESIGVLPDISITIEEMNADRLNASLGIAAHKRKDHSLYLDYAQPTKPPGGKKGAAAAAAGKLQSQAEEGAGAGPSSQAQATQKEKGSQAPRGTSYYRITVRDNGMGMAHSKIPDMLGRVLSGTKYGVRQTRGKFGLGAKMALMWAQMSTGAHVEIYSAQKGSPTRSHYILGIDIGKNQPIVDLEELLDNPKRWHGAELTLVLAGNWQFYRSKVLKYLRQIAVITPYAQFEVEFKSEEREGSGFHIKLARRTDQMPRPPQVALHHPAAVDLELLQKLVRETKQRSLESFLCKDFDCMTKDLARRLLDELKEDPSDPPSALGREGALRLHQLLHSVHIPAPKGHHLSPAGEYNLRLGVMKELRPDLVATFSGYFKAIEGHAFHVEAVVSLGGREIKPGINVFRFANRIPLLFESGSDVATKTALTRVHWPTYKINPQTDKVGVFVSIVSTKIPFKGAGKEYVADDIEELRTAVRSAILGCCAQLKLKIARQQAQRALKDRKKILIKYIPNVSEAIFRVLDTMAEEGARGPKRRRLEEDHGVLDKVQRGEVTAAQLAAKLEEHVDRMDAENALEYQMQQGLAEKASVDAFLVPRAEGKHAYAPDIHGATFVFRPLAATVEGKGLLGGEGVAGGKGFSLDF